MSYRSWQLKNLPPENPTWGITEILICFITSLLLKSVFGFIEPMGFKILGYLVADVSKQGALYYLISIIISNLVVILLSIFLVKKRYSSIKELGITSSDLFRGLTTGVISGIFIFLTVIGIGLFFGNILGIHEHLQNFVKYFLQGKGSIRIAFYITAICIVPFGQAILFQGLMYPVLKNGTGKVFAFLMVGIIFAASIFDLQRIIPLFFAGFILTYIYEKSGNLFAPIIANSVWQGLMLWLISVTSWK